jgi:putative multicomponent Na+:H+ antiporter subunit B
MTWTVSAMTDGYLYVIVALLPLAALMLVIQTDPYQALVLRGILGAIAALVYAILGGADVALTEALVGTMLAITLYAVAVRSSLVMRLGVLAGDEVKQNLHWQPMLVYLRALLKRYQLRLELLPYEDLESLNQALADKQIHATCLRLHPVVPTDSVAGGSHQAIDQAGVEAASSEVEPPYELRLRVPRLHEIFTTELPPALATIKPLPANLVSPNPSPVLRKEAS